MNRYAIIVAGGIGSRMGAKQPKQFLLLKGKPILVHTIEKFLTIPNLSIILTLPKEHFSAWETIKKTYFPQINIQAIEGGETRYHSVKNGLNTIQNTNSLVAIHDGVRPLVSTSIIEKSFIEAEIHQSAIVSVPLKDSIRHIENGTNTAKNRAEYCLIQTPQTFNTFLLKKAFEHGYQPNFTDDASVFEFDKNTIHLIEGDYTNIKITTQEDLIFAEAMLSKSDNF